MYVPKAFAIEDTPAIHNAMDAVGLALLVTATAAGPVATHLPLLLVREEGEFGTLYGHVARANRHWQAEGIGEALAVFQGADGYVTPSWYPTKAETGRVVPTWNYLAVHAGGPVTFVEDRDRLLDVVTRLTERQEAPRARPWSVEDAPADHIATLLRAIVGLRLPIRTLQASFKMNQTKQDRDRRGALEGLRAEGGPAIARLADAQLRLH
ncbi:MAG: FMN-binding negative transcriptional regulator [Proteobacteria bacterium]|nr:FMN-binding negative transcriptional regulator [Pseudomonadota bacterium]